jgi:hypothetical protein
VTKIAEGAINRFEYSFVAAFVFRQLKRTELTAGALFRLVTSESVLHQVGDPALDMELKLGMHAPFPSAFLQPRLFHLLAPLISRFKNQ